MPSPEWCDVEPFYHCQDFIINSYFGEEDAEAEWKSPDISSRQFITTQSYHDFQSENILYLFGRRGTGKTAILNMVHHSANNNTNDKYTCSYKIQSESEFHALSRSLHGSPFEEYPEGDLIDLLIDQWKWIINTGAMIAIYNKHRILQPNRHLNTIHKYLKENDLAIGQPSTIKKITSVITENLNSIDYNPLKMGLVLCNIAKELTSTSYNDALKSLTAIISKEREKCIVLIDSMQRYDTNDKIHRCISTSLIEAVRQTHMLFNETNIIAKAAFPSELHKRIPILNCEVTDRKKLFILWRYKDLVRIIAKRHYEYQHYRNNDQSPAKFETYDESRNYLYRNYIPPTVETQQNITFDTLAYIIKHTQKKPRQAILLFNIIYSYCNKQKGDLNIALLKETIRDGVHARLRLLIDGTFHIFNTFIPGASDLILKILHNSKSHFSDSHLDEMINKASKTRHKLGMSAKEVKELLIESGAIGIGKNIRHVTQDGLLFVEAAFEYQVKDTMQRSKDTEYVLHPMLYQEVQARVDKKRFIYPMPNEDEEKNLMNEMGILLK